jgi:hypothetical protein
MMEGQPKSHIFLGSKFFPTKNTERFYWHAFVWSQIGFARAVGSVRRRDESIPKETLCESHPERDQNRFPY